MKPARATRPEFYRRGFALVAILIAAALVIGVGATLGYQKFYKKPAPSPSPAIDRSITLNQASPSSTDGTENWKTYTNSSLKFQFKYPNDWKVETWQNKIMDSIKSPDYAIDPNEHLEETALVGANLMVPLNREITTLEKFTEAKEGIIVGGSDVTRKRKLTNFKKTTLGGQEALVYDYEAVDKPSLQGSKVEFKTGNNEIYSLDILYSSRSYKRVFDQILSTFKFLE